MNRPPAPTFWQAVGLVAQREISVSIRSKAFLISSAIFLVVIAATVVLGSLGPQLFTSTTTVATVAATDDAVAAVPDVETVIANSADDARTLVELEEVDAAVVPSGDGYLVIADRDAPQSLIGALSITPEVELLDPNAPDPLLTMFIAMGFGIVFFSSAMTFGQGIAMSVVEEKQTRIVEILLASVPARALLAGKIIGSSIMAFGQIVLIATTVFVASSAVDNQILLNGLGTPILWFVALFTVGFVLLASLYGAAGSTVSRVEDLGPATSPLLMLVMIPYMMVIFFNDNPAVMAIMSYIPFSAPVAVPIRVYTHTTEWWEPIVSLGIIIVSIAVVISIAAKVYENSLLRLGKRVTLKEALSSN